MPVTTSDTYDPETMIDQFAIGAIPPPGDGLPRALYLRQWHDRGIEQLRWTDDPRLCRKFRTAADAAEFIAARPEFCAMVAGWPGFEPVAVAPVRTPIT